MKNIVIIGGGFAGLWAALGAARQVIENKADIRITLVSKDPYLNIRPVYMKRIQKHCVHHYYLRLNRST